MKLNTKILITCVLFFSLPSLCAQHFWRGNTMSAEKAGKRWGETSFDAKLFKNGDSKVRASMAASMLRKEKEFKGKTVFEIRDLLGSTDGFYFADVYPTYLIQIGQNHSEETWQLVFLLGEERKVDGLIIHKNCCDK